MRVALVHDWLVGQRGGEHVLEAIASQFPSAPIYTLVHTPKSISAAIESHPIHTSFLQSYSKYVGFRKLLPFFPRAIESFDLSRFELILSTSHCVAKGILTNPSQRHLTYIHTPMRYIWDEISNYIPQIMRPARTILLPAARIAVGGLRRWDRISAQRPDMILANSSHVAERIRRHWQRDSFVCYPPVDTNFFSVIPKNAAKKRSGYIVVSALVPYKRVDLAVVWASRRGEKLTIIGDGPERKSLERLAGPSITFLGRVPRETIRKAYYKAQALLFCGVEDFGIVPLEAISAGCPVVALARGGALETVAEGVTGTFFNQPTVFSLAQGMARFIAMGGADSYSRKEMQQHVDRFSKAQFLQHYMLRVNELLAH